MTALREWAAMAGVFLAGAAGACVLVFPVGIFMLGLGFTPEHHTVEHTRLVCGLVAAGGAAFLVAFGLGVALGATAALRSVRR